MKDEKQTLPLGFYRDCQGCLAFPRFLFVSLRQTREQELHLSDWALGGLPFSEFSADDGGLLSS